MLSLHLPVLLFAADWLIGNGPPNKSSFEGGVKVVRPKVRTMLQPKFLHQLDGRHLAVAQDGHNSIDRVFRLGHSTIDLVTMLGHCGSNLITRLGHSTACQVIPDIFTDIPDTDLVALQPLDLGHKTALERGETATLILERFWETRDWLDSAAWSYARRGRRGEIVRYI